MTGVCDKACDRGVWQNLELVGVFQGMHDRTWNQGLSGHVTGLGTGQSLSRGSDFEAKVWSLSV